MVLDRRVWLRMGGDGLGWVGIVRDRCGWFILDSVMKIFKLLDP